MNRELLELAADLTRRHRPFLIATVVWARGPSSGKQGSSAIITEDGTITGWIGGACAEPAVVREARRAIRDGAARLMYLGPADERDGGAREGVTSIPIACSSEGALEVYMEPVLPQPHVVVVGRSPAVLMLTRLLAAMEWRITVVDDGGDPATHPDADRVVTALDLDGLAIDASTFVVVATQGHYDESALEQALATEAGYIGLIASEKRAATVLGYLEDRGHPPDQIGRIDTPAGLDLGPIQHREIAVAILGDLVRRRAGGEIGAPAGPIGAPATAVDPVCEMTVDIESARWTLDHEGTTYYFCAPGCRKAFEADPAQFVHV